MNAPREHAINKNALLLLVFSIWQFLLHGLCVVDSGDPRLLLPHAISFLNDVVVLGAITFIGRSARAAAPERLGPIVDGVMRATLIVTEVFLAAYPQLLREYLTFPMNIFAADISSARIMVTEYLGISRLWPSMVAGIVGMAVLISRFQFSGWRRTRLVLGILIAVAGITTLPRTPHPLLYSVKEALSTLFANSERAVPRLQRPPGRTNDIPLSSTPISASETLTADHVFLVVLEGVICKDFEKDIMQSNSGFLSLERDRAAYFSQYHATNLDSYTSLITMLASIQVPYRAYADESLYEAVYDAPSLTRSLRAAGYFSVFLSTYAVQPFVPTRNDWDQIMDRGNISSLEDWVSVGSSRMEAATEDRAALSIIVDIAFSHPRTFVVHEMVYGHSPEWRAKTGVTQLAYYDAYLRDLVERLKAKGLFSRSLIVVVSDHGDRAKSADAENYRVPLLVLGSTVEPSEDSEFRSHVNLWEIIESYLRKKPLPKPLSEVLVVGSSERWVYGIITANRDYLFLDDLNGVVLSSNGALNVSTVAEKFQKGLDEFGSRYGQVRPDRGAATD
jgi:hypothetical protein